MGWQKPRRPQSSQRRAHLDGPAGDAPSTSCTGATRVPWRRSRARTPRETAEKVPPPRRRRPRAPRAPQPPRQARGRGGEPAARGGTVPGAGEAPAAPLPPPGARDPRGAQPVLTAPRLRSSVGGHRGQRGPSRSRVAAGRGTGGGRAAAADEKEDAVECAHTGSPSSRSASERQPAAAVAGALSPPARPPPLPAAPAPGPPRPAFPPPPLCASGPQRPRARTPGRPRAGRSLGDAAPKGSPS